MSDKDDLQKLYDETLEGCVSEISIMTNSEITRLIERLKRNCVDTEEMNQLIMEVQTASKKNEALIAFIEAGSSVLLNAVCKAL